MTRFLINKDGVYYLTTGKLLTYDHGRARSEQQKADVKRVEREFARISDLPHTWYKAVEVSDEQFLAVNTGPSD